MVDMDEAAVAAEATVEATKGVVEPGITMEAVEARTIIMNGASMRPRRVTVLRHPRKTREGTSLRR
jgi:hypothetical protein